MEGDGGTPRRVVRVPHTRLAAKEKVPLSEKVRLHIPFSWGLYICLYVNVHACMCVSGSLDIGAINEVCGS